jgi:sugar phosphate isomerase/epimerase
MKLGATPADLLPLRLSGVCQPGVIISNAWPQSRTEEGATVRAIEQVLDKHPFFGAFQTVDIPFAAERRRVREVLRNEGRPHTYTLTRVLGEQKLNLSSLDTAVRRKSCEVVRARLDDAQEAGATGVGLISGPRPAEPALRFDALRALEESLAELAPEAAKRDGLELILEPLDYDSHKRCSLGTAKEAVALCDRLAAYGKTVRLCLDVAHMVLNGEDIIAAVATAHSHIVEFHFCNAVTDATHPLFGDHHLFFGAPGVIGIPQIGELMAGLVGIGYFAADVRPRVYCEVWKPDEVASLAVVAHCENALRAGWSEARRLVTV